MRKVLVVILCSTAFFSRKKDAKLPSNTKQTEGILHYDNFPDGFGLYYRIDFTDELILFQNKFSSGNAQYQFYKGYVNVHSRLYYLDHGDSGCVFGLARVWGFRLVEAIKLEKD
jgi:hypothetical protein